jgi:RNA polymerase sigma-70 factor (ECF subfamily)
MSSESTGLQDEDLVERSLAGDAGAFEGLVSRYQQAVFNIAYYKSRNCFDAEDLAQDVFLAAFRALRTLKDPKCFASWLFGIAYNRCHKWYHRERNKIVKIEEIRRHLEQESRLSWRAARATLSADETDSSAVEEFLRQLPEDARAVIRLKYLEGLSYEEIEGRLGIKTHRIDYLIRRSKKALRERVAREDDPSDLSSASAGMSPDD